MMGVFSNLAEFEALCNEEKIDLESVDTALDRLCFKKLNSLLSPVALVRVWGVWQWVNELNKITSCPITVHTTKEEIIPYMHEGGIICFGKKDFHRVDKLFMLFAHESAHFILTDDKNYALIKHIDSEYCAMPGRDKEMNSPIEKCANIITLRVLHRCEIAEKNRKKQKTIKLCIKTLEKQLT